uniref:RxLR effector candidate protein n=1 Tax=Hyaloperonospora arabidopsidis (strain Emoy2) TaxID=559515 RepID=M4B3N5_HYAAE
MKFFVFFALSSTIFPLVMCRLASSVNDQEPASHSAYDPQDTAIGELSSLHTPQKEQHEGRSSFSLSSALEELGRLLHDATNHNINSNTPVFDQSTISTAIVNAHATVLTETINRAVSSRIEEPAIPDGLVQDLEEVLICLRSRTDIPDGLIADTCDKINGLVFGLNLGDYSQDFLVLFEDMHMYLHLYTIFTKPNLALALHLAWIYDSSPNSNSARLLLAQFEYWALKGLDPEEFERELAPAFEGDCLSEISRMYSDFVFEKNGRSRE